MCEIISSVMIWVQGALLFLVYLISNYFLLLLLIEIAWDQLQLKLVRKTGARGAVIFFLFSGFAMIDFPHVYHLIAPYCSLYYWMGVDGSQVWSSLICRFVLIWSWLRFWVSSFCMIDLFIVDRWKKMKFVVFMLSLIETHICSFWKWQDDDSDDDDEKKHSRHKHQHHHRHYDDEWSRSSLSFKWNSCRSLLNKGWGVEACLPLGDSRPLRHLACIGYCKLLRHSVFVAA